MEGERHKERWPRICNPSSRAATLPTARAPERRRRVLVPSSVRSKAPSMAKSRVCGHRIVREKRGPERTRRRLARCRDHAPRFAASAADSGRRSLERRGEKSSDDRPPQCALSARRTPSNLSCSCTRRERDGSRRSRGRADTPRAPVWPRRVGECPGTAKVSVQRQFRRWNYMIWV